MSYRLACLALLALAAITGPAHAQPKARKVAFLVGVGAYKHDLADLGGVPEKDVAELEIVLKKHGFEVVTVTAGKATKP